MEYDAYDLHLMAQADSEGMYHRADSAMCGAAYARVTLTEGRRPSLPELAELALKDATDEA